MEELKLYKKFLRLSSQRDLYTISQAAFRLNCGVNDFKRKYVESGLVRLVVMGGRLFVPAKEINYAIEQMQTVVHKKSLQAVSGKL